MTDEKPRKTLSIPRKPATTASNLAPTGIVTRSGKRVIRVNPAAPQPTSTQKSPTGTGRITKKKRPRKPAPKKPVITPSDMKARELNDRLNSFPIWLNYQPLIIGIDKDVFRLVNEEHFPGASKQVVRKVLATHTHHRNYLQAIAQGGARHRLNGVEDGEITVQHQQAALERLAK